jgi:hypothetical protein
MKTVASRLRWKEPRQGIVSGERVSSSVTPNRLNFLSNKPTCRGMSLHVRVGGVFPSGLLIGTVQISLRELDVGAACARWICASRRRVRGDGKQMIFFILLLILTFLAQIVEFLFRARLMCNARLHRPGDCFYGAMALPFRWCWRWRASRVSPGCGHGAGPQVAS